MTLSAPVSVAHPQRRARTGQRRPHPAPLRPASGSGAVGAEVRLHGAVLPLSVLGGLLLAFDDIGPLLALGGPAAASPGWLPLLLAGYLARPTGAAEAALARALRRLFTWGVVVTALTLAVLPVSYRDEDLRVKAVKVGLSVAVWLTLVVVGYRLCRRDDRTISAIGGTAVAAMLAFILVEGAGLVSVGVLELVHGTPDWSQRLRGSRFEPSSLGAGFLVCASLALLPRRGTWSLLVLATACLASGLLLQSRGTMVVGVLAALVAPVLLWMKVGARAMRSSSRLSGAAFVAAACMLGFFLALLITSEAFQPLRAADSDATRSIWSLTAARSLWTHPLGMGFSGGLVWLEPLLRASVAELAWGFTSRDLYEVSFLLGGATDVGFSPKTIIGISAVHLGLPGVMVLLRAVYQLGAQVPLLAGRGHSAAGLAVVILVFVTCSYYGTTTAWEQGLALGALLALVARTRETLGGESCA